MNVAWHPSCALRVDEVVNTNDMILTCGAPSITEHHRATAVPFDPVAAKAAKVESHALIRFNQDVLISFDKIHNRCIIV